MNPGRQTPKTLRIARIELDDGGRRGTPEAEHERAVAIHDLLHANHFAPTDSGDGPFTLTLSLAEDRLLIGVRDNSERELTPITLPVRPFRQVVRDYFLVCESYYEAIKQAPPSRIEALDMGRRAVHDEGSDMLRQRLSKSATIDHETARRLFTLFCVLHLRVRRPPR